MRMGIYQRHYIRVDYRQVISLKTSVGLTLSAQTNNISVAGIGVVCDQATACSIVPDGHHFNLSEAANLVAEFCLDDCNDPIGAACKVRNVRRLAEDSYGFNLEFVKLKASDKQRLDDFVNQQSF